MKNAVMKKILAGLLLLTILFTMVACGSSPSGNNTQTTGTTEPSLEPTQPKTEPATEPVTEPQTEPATEPQTEPATEPATEEPTRGIEPTESKQEPTYDVKPLVGAVPESGRADPSYFSDAVFVGDSVSLKLSYYEAAMDVLGSAQFLTSGSLGSGNALWNVSSESVHPTFDGQKTLIEEAIARMGVKKVYIMLGMNDIALYGVDGAVNNLKTLIGRIKENSPYVVFYIQSMTPTTSTSNLGSGHKPAKIQEYNQKLLNMCQQNGWYFVDVASVMYDENGYLRRSYCSDPDGMGIHFTNEGCAAWVDYLYTHTAG